MRSMAARIASRAWGDGPKLLSLAPNRRANVRPLRRSSVSGPVKGTVGGNLATSRVSGAPSRRGCCLLSTETGFARRFALIVCSFSRSCRDKQCPLPRGGRGARGRGRLLPLPDVRLWQPDGSDRQRSHRQRSRRPGSYGALAAMPAMAWVRSGGCCWRRAIVPRVAVGRQANMDVRAAAARAVGWLHSLDEPVGGGDPVGTPCRPIDAGRRWEIALGQVTLGVDHRAIPRWRSAGDAVNAVTDL